MWRGAILNSFAAAFVCGAGDTISQYLVHRHDLRSSSTSIAASSLPSPSPSSVPSHSQHVSPLPPIYPLSSDAKFHQNYHRSTMLALWGFLTGPPMFFWYRMLDSFYPLPLSTRNLFIKIAINQSTFAVVLNFGFFCWTTLWSQKWPDYHTYEAAAYKKVREEMPHTTLKSCQLWAILHYISFRWLPPSSRVLYQNTMGIGWISYLSYRGHAEDASLA
jgi:hypothetical protein